MTNVFSEEIPQLFKEHLSHLLSSAISLDVIKERGYKSLLGTAELKSLGFKKNQQRHPGILIPLYGVDGKIFSYQYRPDNPREQIKNDGQIRKIKYENPVGASVRLDVPPRCLKDLGNPAIPLFFTEGIKKVDALATAGACAIGLTGVWGFKGKNAFGASTFLADFDYMAMKDRLVYLVFDSDSATNPQVQKALERFTEHLHRKGSQVKIVRLPQGLDGNKTGADDFLAQGHKLDDLIKLADDIEADEQAEGTFKSRCANTYDKDGGFFSWVKNTEHGPTKLALCNFLAEVTQEVKKDNGLEISRFFKVSGSLWKGERLPEIEIPANAFNSLNWVTSEWGMKAIITAGQSTRDRLREAIQGNSDQAMERTIYTHLGWRTIGESNAPVFLTAAGAIGAEKIDVEMEPQLKSYQLPQPVGDPQAALRASLRFLDIGKLEVTLPIWTGMYLAPLAELLEPAFTLFYTGPSGAYKSVLSALALCHFGKFDYLHLPASWRDTANQLEKLLFLCKDVPLVIDDWAPGQDSNKARELEVKAEHIIRAQGNRQGKGRMRADTSSRPNYTPRGILITSGEQLPSGHSHTARIFTVPIEPGDIDRNRLTQAQNEQNLYNLAMSHYVQWLREDWTHLKSGLPGQFEKWRDRAYSQGMHTRLPAAIAWLTTALTVTLSFFIAKGVLTDKEANELKEKGFQIFTRLAAEQGGRVEEERPSIRFVEGLKAILSSGTAVLDSKDTISQQPLRGNQVLVGWRDTEHGHILINQEPAYQAVYQFFLKSGQPFTFKPEAVWRDLKRTGHISEFEEGRCTKVATIYGESKRCVWLKSAILQDTANDTNTSDI